VLAAYAPSVEVRIVARLLGQQVSGGAPLDEAMRTVCRRLNGAFGFSKCPGSRTA